MLAAPVALDAYFLPVPVTVAAVGFYVLTVGNEVHEAIVLGTTTGAAGLILPAFSVQLKKHAPSSAQTLSVFPLNIAADYVTM